MRHTKGQSAFVPPGFGTSLALQARIPPSTGKATPFT